MIKAKSRQYNLSSISMFFQAGGLKRFFLHDNTQKALTKALLKPIACDQLSLSIVESQTFKNFC